MALTKIGTDGVKDDAITSGKIPANAIGASELAPNSVSLNHLGQGSSATDGKFLRANNGADPTFETVNTDLVADSSPQLGGSLDTNGNAVKFADNIQANFGTSDDSAVRFNGTDLVITTAGKIKSYAGSAGFEFNSNDNNDTFAKFIKDGAIELYHDNTKVFETGADRIFAKARFNINADGINSGDGIGFGQWDGSNHRIEGDSNRPMFITSYNSSGIKLGASGAVKATVTNNGLTFNGDTAAANALDDYEEGTFTVGLGRTGSNPSASFYNQSGRYIKIGKLVYCFINLDAYNVSGGSGQWTCTGFPFNTYNDSAIGWANTWVMGRLYFDGDYAMGVNGKSLRTNNNTNTWYLYNQDIDNTVTANASRIIFQGHVTYMTN